jgi:hypothetical protein
MADREIRYVKHRTPPVDILPEEAVAAIREAIAWFCLKRPPRHRS